MDVPSPQTLDTDISGLPVHPYSTGKILNSATITRPLVPETERTPSAATTRGIIDWTAMQLRPDPQVTTIAASRIAIPGAELPQYLELYTELYFDHFHHRWPIIHRASREEEAGEAGLCELSIAMIGAWLSGTSKAMKYATETHAVLIDHITPQLCQITSHDRFQQSLSAELCNAALLNMVFALYYGHERELSRAIILWNIQMAVLRETGFFKPETAWHDEKKGIFPPLRWTKLGQRQRIAYNMFKLDAYICFLRSKPMTSFPEELHFPFPCTLSTWDSVDLHVWEERQLVEPAHRNSKSMFSSLTSNVVDTGSTQSLLVEDINLCLCAMQPDINKHFQSSATQTASDINIVVRTDILRRRLDRLHMRLDQFMVQSTVNSDQTEQHLLRHYYGYEDHALPNCHTTVGTRLRCILFDTFMLYHLLSMHLSVDVPKLTQIVKDRRLSTIEESSEAHCLAREKRQTSMIGWALTPAARSALCQAVDVLVAHQNLRKSTEASVDIRTLDPICHVALSVSALIVWTFCKYQDGAFDSVVVGAGPVAELTAWSMSGDQFAKERKAWIEMGEQSSCSQPRLQGIGLCDTNTDFLMVFFQACLPHGWALADIIAPGIFKFST
ncbi:hypothetical protein OCU04_008882 [Sclerotinia nivalis]|nr:hypothetical protein OCU04_008882 [Sclerotinia nivalis]